MQEKINPKTGWKHLLRSDMFYGEDPSEEFRLMPPPRSINRAPRSTSSRLGIRVGSEDIEKSRFIDQVINRLRH